MLQRLDSWHCPATGQWHCVWLMYRVVASRRHAPLRRNVRWPTGQVPNSSFAIVSEVLGRDVLHKAGVPACIL